MRRNVAYMMIGLLLSVQVVACAPAAQGDWLLNVRCLDDEWHFTAQIPFHVSEDGALAGEGEFEIKPGPANTLITPKFVATGTMRVGGQYVSGGFEFVDFLQLVEYNDYEQDSPADKLVEMVLWRLDIADQMIDAQDGVQVIFNPSIGPICTRGQMVVTRED